MGSSHNAYVLAADFSMAGAEAQEKADRITKHHAMLLQTQIQANASGRPGPNAPTGDYRRSWNVTMAGSAAIVGTGKPQARRLEWGFVGPDRLGRVYNQQPYPHVGPAVETVTPAYHASLAELLDDI